MPIYEYICKKCEKNFSLLQRLGATEEDTICPACGSNDIKKKLSAFSCSPGNGPLSSHFSGFGGGG